MKDLNEKVKQVLEGKSVRSVLEVKDDCITCPKCGGCNVNEVTNGDESMLKCADCGYTSDNIGFKENK